MSEKLTPWFGDMTKPSHVGWYDTKWLRTNKPRRLFWCGAGWLNSPDGAACTLQCFFWRGLVSKS